MRNGNLPQLSIIRLPNDHTAYTFPGMPTPRAMVADNDLALGRIVDDLHSPYWKDSAIFVVEDDAQAGPDHVDAHRSVALIISPYVRHAAVDQRDLHHLGHFADDGADSGAAADEPDKRRQRRPTRRSSQNPIWRRSCAGRRRFRSIR